MIQRMFGAVERGVVARAALCALSAAVLAVAPSASTALAVVWTVATVVISALPSGPAAPRVPPTALRRGARTLLGTVCGAVALYATAVALGAPAGAVEAAAEAWIPTALFAWMVAMVTAAPVAGRVGLRWTRWARALDSTHAKAAPDIVRLPVVCAAGGAWVAAAGLVLDWRDMPLLLWPTPCLIGAWVGYVVAAAFVLVTRRPRAEY